MFLSLELLTFAQQTPGLIAHWSMNASGDYTSNIGEVSFTKMTNFAYDINGIKNGSSLLYNKMTNPDTYFNATSKTPFFNLKDDYTLFYWFFMELPIGPRFAFGPNKEYYPVGSDSQNVWIQNFGGTDRIWLRFGNGEEISGNMLTSIAAFDLYKWHWICLRKKGVTFTLNSSKHGQIWKDDINAFKNYDVNIHSLFVSPGWDRSRLDDIFLFNKFISDDELSRIVSSKLNGETPAPINHVGIRRAITLMMWAPSSGVYNIQTSWDLTNWHTVSTVMLYVGSNAVYMPAEHEHDAFRVVPKYQ